MNTRRAVDIFYSKGVIEVHYQGYPVWIEQINKNMAGVLNLRTNERSEVSVNDLVEG